MTEQFDPVAPPPARALDPREAAKLLVQTTRYAERRFELRPPWLTLVGAVVVLVAYGVVWLSVRHQHVYVGPAGWALAVLYSTIALWAVLISVVHRRATSGVGGRAARQRKIEGLTFAAIWICVYVVQGALDHAGADKAIVYGIWPAAAPLIVVGSAAAAYEAGRGKAATTAFAIAAVVLGAAATFTGPRAVWGVMAIGLCALVLAGAAAQVWERRHA